jgi:hypothetical protein
MKHGADETATWHAVAMTPILPVTGVERSVTWFRDVMGFGINFIDGSWASLGKDGFELLLNAVGHPPEPRWIFIHVGDVDQVFEGFRSGPGLGGTGRVQAVGNSRVRARSSRWTPFPHRPW